VYYSHKKHDFMMTSRIIQGVPHNAGHADKVFISILHYVTYHILKQVLELSPYNFQTFVICGEHNIKTFWKLLCRNLWYCTPDSFFKIVFVIAIIVATVCMCVFCFNTFFLNILTENSHMSSDRINEQAPMEGFQNFTQSDHGIMICVGSSTVLLERPVFYISYENLSIAAF